MLDDAGFSDFAGCAGPKELSGHQPAVGRALPCAAGEKSAQHHEDLELDTRWSRAWTAAVVALAWSCALCGCRSVPRTKFAAELAAMPPAARSQVQIYLVGSPLDGFELAGLPAMKQHLREIGFENAEHITWTTPAGLADRIASDQRRRPVAHVMLVGWSLGCLQVLEAAARLEGQELEVDSVVCLDGNPWIKLQGVRNKYPQLSEKVVCIYPRHRDLPGGLARTRQRQVGAWHHFGVPLHEETIETILSELATVARSDSTAEPGEFDMPQPDQPLEPDRLPWYVTEAMPARQLVARGIRDNNVRQAQHW